MSKKKAKAAKDEDAEEAPKATEGADGEVIEHEDGPKKGKRKLIIIVAAVVVLAAGAGLFFSGVLGSKAPKKEGDEAATTEPAKDGKDGKAEKDAQGNPIVANAPVYYELPQFLVNLNATGSHVSFLKMSVTLELRDKAAVPIMDANKPRIVDTFNTYLRELRPTDIQGSAGIYHLRTELMARLNSTIDEGIVKDILFGELIVQ